MNRGRMDQVVEMAKWSMVDLNCPLCQGHFELV